MKYDEATLSAIRKGRAKFIAMAVTYFLGVFNDNFFKQAALLLAIAAGLSKLQGDATLYFSLPFVLFSAYAGWLADRFSKGKVVIWAKVLELAAMIIGAIGIITLNWPCIMAMVFLIALQTTIFGPALNGSIPELYPAVYVPQANSILRAVTTGAILIGIALAGISLDQKWMDLPVPFGRVLVVVTVLVVAIIGLVASFGVHQKKPANGRRPFPWAGPLQSLVDLWEVKKDLELDLAIAASTCFYFLSSLAVLVLNTIGLRQFGFSNTTTSLLSVALMIGIAVGALVAGRVVSMKRWSRLLGPAMAGIGFSLLLVGAVPGFSGVWRFYSLSALFVITGFFGGLFLIPIASFIQVRPAASEKGRVIAVHYFCDFCAIMLSGPIFKLLDGSLSPTSSMMVLGGFAVVAALVFFLYPGKDLVSSTVFAAVRGLLRFRYTVTVTGLKSVHNRGSSGILFLPNHPALIDPVILTSHFYPDFKPRPLADYDQANRPVVKQVITRLNPVIIPDLTKVGQRGSEAVMEALAGVIDGLKQGDNILLYPSGHIYRSYLEDVGANSAVEIILSQVPDARVVLVRTRGLWGSSLSWAKGRAPRVGSIVVRYLLSILVNLLLFIPRRAVNVELHEPADFPVSADRLVINRYLERFYNKDPLPNTYVPYFWWEGYTPKTLPEPEKMVIKGDTSRVPPSTRTLVMDHLLDMIGVDTIRDTDRLANDLGMDSLSQLELMSWLGEEFGLPLEDLESLQTVGDCLLAASGEAIGKKEIDLKPIPSGWFRDRRGGRLTPGAGKTIPEVFLSTASRQPGSTIVADQISGALTYRRFITGILALKPEFEAIPSEAVGIMLPAAVSAALSYMTTLFSGKIPVMVNWTVGEGHMAYCLKLAGVTHVVTARALLERLKQQGFDPDAVGVTWICLEDVAKRITVGRKLSALAKSYCSWSSLRAAPVSPIACILFTSGSEANPKAVPLTHENILANVKDISEVVTFRPDDRLLGMLPPFHSLGLTGTIISPLVVGVKTAYHTNPTESVALSRLIESYQASITVGTPTFLNGIVRAASPGQLRTLRLVVTGAEKCPDYVYQALSDTCPEAVICEGYGITECSPVVSLNREDDPHPGTIGTVIPSMEYVIVNAESLQPVQREEQGMLLVRGPNVFSGYLKLPDSSPFVEFDGRQWYRTGDLVTEDAEGVLTFRGRLKRFIKLGGEMISLPAIEAVLSRSFSSEEGEEGGPLLAVEATPSEDHPEIVLFTTIDVKREEVNRHIRQDGLSALHNIRRVIRLDTIPVLGTGKTNYRELKGMLLG